MKSQIYIYILIAILSVSCSTQEMSPTDETVDDHHDHETMTEVVELTPTQIKNVGLQFDTLTMRPIRSTIQLTGRVELPPTGKSVASSQLSGQVSTVHVIAGEHVRAGQTLFTIKNLEVIDWQQELVSERATLSYLEAEVTRQKEISERNLGSKKSYDDALQQFNRSTAKVKALESKLKSIGIPVEDGASDFKSTFRIVAPSAGVVQHLLVSKGQFVDANMELAEIINTHHLHLHLVAFGTDVAQLQKDQVLDFYVQSRPEDILQAKIWWINSIVDEESNSYDVHAEIMGDHGHLSAGEFVEARVLERQTMVSTLPAGAVTTDRGLHYIFTQAGADAEHVQFNKVQVEVGITDLGFVEVNPIDPIEPGTAIVTEGAFFVMAQSKKGEEGAGHHH